MAAKLVPAGLEGWPRVPPFPLKVTSLQTRALAEGLSDLGSDASLGRDGAGLTILKRHQDLPPEAFYSPEEAVEVFDRGDRSLLVLSQ